MGVFPIGDQRIGIVTHVPVLDGNGDPIVSEYMEPETTDVVVWVDRCVFEIQTPTEQQNMTVTTSEIAWAVMPIVGGVLPTVDGAGNPVGLVLFDTNGNAVMTDGQTALNSGMRLRHNGLTYVMRGDAVLEQDIRGRHDHVFCVCEREKG